MQTENQKYVVVDLPQCLAQFRSVKSGAAPFVKLLEHLRSETAQPELSFSDIALGPVDFAELKAETTRWVLHRRRLGLEARDAGTFCLSIESVTAPVVNRRLRPGHALVAFRAAAVA